MGTTSTTSSLQSVDVAACSTTRLSRSHTTHNSQHRAAAAKRLVTQRFAYLVKAAYLVRAWDVRNSCKHNGAVLMGNMMMMMMMERCSLFLPPRGGGRGADRVDAMA
jgi:hypothetical protein